MAFDAKDFIVPESDFAGLYKLGDTLERRRVRDQQIEQQQQGRRHATAQFLQNYLDPKDFMTGTHYDPMIVKGLDDAMQQGMALAAKGVDTPTMMMALGPVVKKMSDYSVRAKTLNTTLDDQIKKMQQSDLNGYDYAALKREAMKSAMFDVDPQTGKATLNPQKADAGIDWISKTIQDNPELVTTNAALDEFAKKSPMEKRFQDVTFYTPKGEMDRQKYHTIGQNWLQPVLDQTGRPTDMVPKYEEANDSGKPLTHPFTGKDGKVTDATVRLFDEELFDKLPAPVIHRIQALTKQHIGDYKYGGEAIGLNHPKSKLVARAIAYDELNARKASQIENAGVENKPSPQQINFKMQNTPEYMDYLEKRAAATARGRESVPTTAEQEKADKGNAGTAIGKIFKNDPDYLTAGPTAFSGSVKEYGTDKVTPLKANVVDVTTAFPGGGLKKGRGEDDKFGKIMYDPQSRSLIVERETGTGAKKKTTNELIPESKVGQFIYEIAEANGIPRGNVKKLLGDIGYGEQKFAGAGKAPEMPQAAAGSKTAPAPQWEKLDAFEKDAGVSKLNSFKGMEIEGQKISDIEGIYNPLNTNEYRVILKDVNGNKHKKEFKTKEKLAAYLKSAQQHPAQPASKSATKGILD